MYESHLRNIVLDKFFHGTHAKRINETMQVLMQDWNKRKDNLKHF